MVKCMMYDKKGFRKRILLPELVSYYEIPITSTPPQSYWAVSPDAILSQETTVSITRITFRLVGKHKEYYIFREI